MPGMEQTADISSFSVANCVQVTVIGNMHIYSNIKNIITYKIHKRRKPRWFINCLPT